MVRRAPDGYITQCAGDRLTVQQAIMYDAAADEENPWFMAYDDDWILLMMSQWMKIWHSL